MFILNKITSSLNFDVRVNYNLKKSPKLQLFLNNPLKLELDMLTYTHLVVSV